MGNGLNPTVNEVDNLSREDREYFEQMEAWVKEQEAREKQIRATIDTSSEIVKQNQIQLEWHIKRMAPHMKEYDEWRESVGLGSRK
ncbi:hypothetical protein [Paenibacillus alvei]